MTTNACPTCLTTSPTAECTIDAIVALKPENTSILNAFGIDTCCGGRSTLGDAAQRARVSAAVVLDALLIGGFTQPAKATAPSACSCGCAGH
jgi:iron-sulfur cluster repair protein YtfE (RIC family)